MIKSLLKMIVMIIIKIVKKVISLGINLGIILVTSLYDFIVEQIMNFNANRKTYKIDSNGNVSSHKVKEAIKEDNQTDIFEGLDNLMDEIIERDSDPEKFEYNKQMEEAKKIYNKEMIDNKRKNEGFEIL